MCDPLTGLGVALVLLLLYPLSELLILSLLCLLCAAAGQGENNDQQ